MQEGAMKQRVKRGPQKISRAQQKWFRCMSSHSSGVLACFGAGSVWAKSSAMPGMQKCQHLLTVECWRVPGIQTPKPSMVNFSNAKSTYIYKIIQKFSFLTDQYRSTTGAKIIAAEQRSWSRTQPGAAVPSRSKTNADVSWAMSPSSPSPWHPWLQEQS